MPKGVISNKREYFEMRDLIVMYVYGINHSLQ